MAETKPIATLTTTTLRLLDQFTDSLNSTPSDGTAPPPNTPSPLPLLSTCAVRLRAQITKLSLLVITPPFTPSAISTILASLNDAILPSLLTAILLLSPSTFTKAYSAEANSLARATFRDLKHLAHLVSARSEDGKPKAEPSSQQKSDVTAVTGKIWEDCDELKQLADNGIGGFVVKRAEQYLELIKDAVKEIEDWDPEDDSDSDSDEDGFVNEDNDQDSPTSQPPANQTNTTTTTASSSSSNVQVEQIKQLKPLLLKTLQRIPQSLHVVLHQRLKKRLLPHTPTTTSPPSTPIPIPPHLTPALTTLLTSLSQTSTCIDDAAERLYTHDPLGAILTVEKARACVAEAVEGVLDGEGWWRFGGRPGESDRGEGRREGKVSAAAAAAADETKEDRYLKRALDWISAVGIQPSDLTLT